MDLYVVVVIVAVLLIATAGIVVWRRRGRRPAQFTADPPQPSVGMAELTCPACGHRFRPPDIIVTTKAIARRYGPNPVQCPRCDHIGSGPPRHTIRG